MERWQNIHKVVVVGLGITGLSVVKHLTKTQPQLAVKVIDTRTNLLGLNACLSKSNCTVAGGILSGLQKLT